MLEVGVNWEGDTPPTPIAIGNTGVDCRLSCSLLSFTSFYSQLKWTYKGWALDVMQKLNSPFPVQKLCSLSNIKFCIRSFKAENKFCMTVKVLKIYSKHLYNNVGLVYLFMVDIVTCLTVWNICLIWPRICSVCHSYYPVLFIRQHDWSPNTTFQRTC